MNHKNPRIASIRFPQTGGPGGTSFFKANRAKESPPSMAVELTDSELAAAHGGSGPNVQVLPYEGSRIFTNVAVVELADWHCYGCVQPCQQCPGDYGDVWGGKAEATAIIATWTEITNWFVNILLANIIPAVLRAVQLQQAAVWLENVNAAVNTTGEVATTAETVEGGLEAGAELLTL